MYLNSYFRTNELAKIKSYNTFMIIIITLVLRTIAFFVKSNFLHFIKMSPVVKVRF